MPRLQWASAAAAGVMLLAAAGCHRQYSTPYPAPYAQPGYAQPDFGTPQGIPPGAVRQPDGSYILPGPAPAGATFGAPSPYGSTSPSGPTLAPPQGSGGNAPPFNTYGNGTSPTPAGGVPNYEDPGAGDFDNFGPQPPAGARPNDGFEPPAGNGTSTPFYPDQGSLPRPLSQEQASRPLTPAVANATGRDYFSGLDRFQADRPTAGTAVRTDRPATPPVAAQPVTNPNFAVSPTQMTGGFTADRNDAFGTAASPPASVQPAGFAEDARRPPPADFGFDPVTSPAAPGLAPRATGTASSDAFGYERGQYGWLRGVVDFDPHLKTWNLIYAVTPDADDHFGGSLTLHDAQGLLRDYQNADVVQVTGRPDPTAGTDPLGKPVYRITRAELVGRYE